MNQQPRNGYAGDRSRRRSRRILGTLIYLFLLCCAGFLGGLMGWRSHHRHSAEPAPISRFVPRFQLPSLPAVFSKPAAPVLLTAGTQPIPIIMYHDVTRRKEVWFDLTTREFRKQMADLKEAGAHPISLQDAYDHLATGKALPDRPIVLTFDDCTLGQFTDALPILKRLHFPATFFVQTASVGVTTSKSHMTWDQLKAAEATGLISVQSHTITHPEDITKLKDDALQRELEESRHTLESEMGHPIPFLAYPSGNCNGRVATAAAKAGYLAAVTMDRGWCASPAQSYFLPRFAPARVEDVLNAWSGTGPMEPPFPRLLKVADAPITTGTFEDGDTPIQWIAGGDLGSTAIQGRQTVGELAAQAQAQAALNGTFFADARVQSTGSAMIGPVLCRVGSVYEAYTPSSPEEEQRIVGRPLIMIGDHRCLILPYAEHLGHAIGDLTDIMPDVKDAFVAGGWIVHFGHAPDRDGAYFLPLRDRAA